MLHNYKSIQDCFIIVNLNADTLPGSSEEESLAFLIEMILLGKIRTKL